MARFALRRLGAALLLLFLVLTGTFFLIHLAPGEPARLFDNPTISEEGRQQLRRLFGLDKPLPQQYVTWMTAALRGDWGYSYSLDRPAFEVLMEKMPATVLLVLAGVTVEHALGLLLGVISAARANTLIDRQIRNLSLLCFSLPHFCIALLMIELFAVRWQLFPINQMRSDGAENWPPLAQALDIARHLVLPVAVIALARFGAVVRFVRNGLLEVMGKDYIRTAHAKGLSPARVLWIHAMRNSLSPLVQRFGVALPILLSGTLIIEVIFSWPGVGNTAFQAIQARDYPVILASTALTGALVVFGSLLADLVHAWIDPRVRHAA